EGDVIQVGDEARVVDSVTDDTHVLLMTGWDGQPVPFSRVTTGAKINECNTDYYGCLTEYELSAPKGSNLSFGQADIGKNIIVQSGLDVGRYVITGVPDCCSDATRDHKVVRVSRWFRHPDDNVSFTMTTDPSRYFSTGFSLSAADLAKPKPVIFRYSHPDFSKCSSTWSNYSSGCVVSDT